ncbi:histidine phosphatase family protein [Bacillus salitolerans]|uniref:Histidine phosphatase family protein n=1 Tax=Bacillus salitolerans TaxID=1437434 RepID=A0ABW4LS01_9BACI
MIKLTNICLVRHGETEWNRIGKLQGRTDVPLNSTGIKQAEECSMFLSDYNWDVIITSPLKRAKKTAEIINIKLRLPFFEMEEFLERGYGDAEGMDMKERLNRFPDGIIPKNEDMHSLKQRVMEGIKNINEKFPNKKVILVAHGAVINSILATLSDGKIGSGKTKLINACISNIHFNNNDWSIMDYNQVTHLSQYNEKRGF